MIDENKSEFVSILASVAEMYGSELSPAGIDLYWRTVGDVSIEDFRRAISAHLNDPDQGRFIPKPCDIRRHLEGTAKGRALVAFDELMGAIEKGGSYRTVFFVDPITSRIVCDFGGWPETCRKFSDYYDERDFSFRQRDFTQRYENYAQTPHPFGFSAVPKPLLGLQERDNEARGYEEEEVKLFIVGDRSEAQKLLEGEPDQSIDVLKKLGVIPGGKS